MSPAEARRRWAEAMIRRSSGPIVTYGSEAWHALPEGSVDRVNAVIIMAEARAREADELEANLRLEVEFARRAFKHDEDADYVHQATAHRQRWSHLPLTAPTYVGQVVEPLEVIGKRYREQRRAS